MKGLKIIILILGCYLTFNLYANNNSSLVIKKSDWEKAAKGVDYTENYKEIEPKEPKNIDFTPLKYNWSPLKYVFYFIVIGLVLFLLYKLLTNLNKNPNIKKQDISIESIAEIEEKIHEIDLEQLLKDALEEGKFHIALRINFLIIIKLLSEKGAIIWAKEKTNWEYYNEIKEALLKNDFKNIILIFEPIWYGEHLLTQEKYHQLQPSFDKFKQQFKTDE